jgi:hypothetical protein
MKITKSKLRRMLQEELSKAQKKLDVDKDGEIEGSDLATLRKGGEETNERLSRLVQEEYSKILNEVELNELDGPEAFAQQQHKAGKGPKAKPDPFALTTIDQIKKLLDDLEVTLGAAPVNEETKPHEDDRHPPDTPEDRIRK